MKLFKRKKTLKKTLASIYKYTEKKYKKSFLPTITDSLTRSNYKAAIGAIVVSESVKKIVNSIDFILCCIKIVDKNNEQATILKESISKTLIDDNKYLEAALIARDVYDTDDVTLLGGWERSNDFDDIMKESVQKGENGLVSHLYCREKDRKKDYIYATAGTDFNNFQDIKTNIVQLYNKETPQYLQSLKIAEALKERIGQEDSLLFVGHSLGGGLATYNAIHTDLKAIVFNPAGLSNASLEDIEDVEKKAGENVECIINANEILNVFQDACQQFEGTKDIPPCIGNRILIYSEKKFWKSHSISSVIEAIEDYMSI